MHTTCRPSLSTPKGVPLVPMEGPWHAATADEQGDAHPDMALLHIHCADGSFLYMVLRSMHSCRVHKYISEYAIHHVHSTHACASPYTPPIPSYTPTPISFTQKTEQQGTDALEWLDTLIQHVDQIHGFEQSVLLVLVMGAQHQPLPVIGIQQSPVVLQPVVYTVQCGVDGGAVVHEVRGGGVDHDGVGWVNWKWFHIKENGFT